MLRLGGLNTESDPRLQTSLLIETLQKFTKTRNQEFFSSSLISENSYLSKSVSFTLAANKFIIILNEVGNTYVLSLSFLNF